MHISRTCWILQKIHQGLCKDGQATNLINPPQEWTPVHHAAFMMMKEDIVQAPILHCPDPARRYIVHTDPLDDACGAPLLQEQDGAKFPVAFISHTFTETKR